MVVSNRGRRAWARETVALRWAARHQCLFVAPARLHRSSATPPIESI